MLFISLVGFVVACNCLKQSDNNPRCGCDKHNASYCIYAIVDVCVLHINQKRIDSLAPTGPDLRGWIQPFKLYEMLFISICYPCGICLYFVVYFEIFFWRWSYACIYIFVCLCYNFISRAFLFVFGTRFFFLLFFTLNDDHTLSVPVSLALSPSFNFVQFLCQN